MAFRRVVSLVLLAAYLPACASYQQTGQSLAELTAPPRPINQARVTLANGSRVQVTTPRVDGDTLRGTEGRSRTSGPPVAIPLTEITVVEIVPLVPPKKMSTGAAVAIVAVSVGIVVLLAVVAGSDCGWLCD